MIARTDTTGFTLVEVLLAASVAAVIAVGVLGALHGVTDHMDRYREETQLANLLQAVAGEILGRGRPTVTEGTFDTHPDYRWKIVEAPLAKAARNAKNPLPLPETSSLTRLVVTVTAPSGRTTTGILVIP